MSLSKTFLLTSICMKLCIQNRYKEISETYNQAPECSINNHHHEINTIMCLRLVISMWYSMSQQHFFHNQVFNHKLYTLSINLTLLFLNCLIYNKIFIFYVLDDHKIFVVEREVIVEYIIFSNLAINSTNPIKF